MLQHTPYVPHPRVVNRGAGRKAMHYGSVNTSTALYNLIQATVPLIRLDVADPTRDLQVASISHVRAARMCRFPVLATDRPQYQMMFGETRMARLPGKRRATPTAYPEYRKQMPDGDPALVSVSELAPNNTQPEQRSE